MFEDFWAALYGVPIPDEPYDLDADIEGRRAYLRARYHGCNVKGIALPPGWAYWADRPRKKKEQESGR